MNEHTGIHEICCYLQPYLHRVHIFVMKGFIWGPGTWRRFTDSKLLLFPACFVQPKSLTCTLSDPIGRGRNTCSPHLRHGKVRLREVTYLAPGHTAHKWRSWDSSLVLRSLCKEAGSLCCDLRVSSKDLSLPAPLSEDPPP